MPEGFNSNNPAVKIYQHKTGSRFIVCNSLIISRFAHWIPDHVRYDDFNFLYQPDVPDFFIINSP